MNDVPALYLCMGSACHQLKGYRLLPVLESLIKEHGLTGRVLLKGAFCLETCQDGCSLKFGNRIFTGLDEPKLRELFVREILPQLQST